MSLNLGEMFFHGGLVMYPLLVFSVLTWAVVLERTFVYLTLRPKLTRLAGSVVQALKSGDAASARQICHAEKPYLAAVFLAPLDTKRTRQHSERVTERNRIRLMGYFKKNLWILATIGSSSPFIGLLGTVIGILRAFHSMSKEGTGGFTVVAGGISESLIATATGLIVAIIALIAYNVFVTAANQTVSGLKLTLEELLDQAFEGGASMLQTPAPA